MHSIKYVIVDKKNMVTVRTKIYCIYTSFVIAVKTFRLYKI